MVSCSVPVWGWNREVGGAFTGRYLGLSRRGRGCGVEGMGPCADPGSLSTPLGPETFTGRCLGLSRGGRGCGEEGVGPCADPGSLSTHLGPEDFLGRNMGLFSGG